MTLDNCVQNALKHREMSKYDFLGFNVLFVLFKAERSHKKLQRKFSWAASRVGSRFI